MGTLNHQGSTDCLHTSLPNSGKLHYRQRSKNLMEGQVLERALELVPEWALELVQERVPESVLVQAPGQVVQAPELVMVAPERVMVALERVMELAQASALGLESARGLGMAALSHSPKLGKMRGRLRQLRSRNHHC